jgi:hypothetical protein
MIDYHRKHNGAYALFKDLNKLPKQDLFIIWDLMTSNPKNITPAERKRFNYLYKEKYDLRNNLKEELLSPFLIKYLLIKFGKKGNKNFINKSL